MNLNMYLYFRSSSKVNLPCSAHFLLFHLDLLQLVKYIESDHMLFYSFTCVKKFSQSKTKFSELYLSYTCVIYLYEIEGI